MWVVNPFSILVRERNGLLVSYLRLESWTFYTTLRYVFLDLEDCPIEVPSIITLISPSKGRDDSSSFPFNFSSLWYHPTKFLNFPCLMRFSISCFKSKHSSVSCPWSLWKQQYLFLLRLLGSPFIFSGYFKEGSSLICISTCSSDMFMGVYCWLHARRTSLLFVSIFLLSCLCLLWTRTLLRMAQDISFHSLSSLPLIVHLIHLQGFLVETSNEGLQAFIFPLLYG